MLKATRYESIPPIYNYTEHSPNLFSMLYSRSHWINSNYPITHQASGTTFERFIQQVTGGNRALYLRLQELFGFVISEVRDVKVIPFLLGPKDSGKSIILRLLEHLVGDEFFTNLSFDELNQPSFLCQLFGKKLNACGEVSEIPLNRLDTLKKLSGSDYVMARFLYGQAFKFVNKAVLLFAGNHLPTIKGIDKSNAFSQRLEIFPFNHPIPKEDQDVHLIDKLIKETPYICKWALDGLKRWCENNNNFTTSVEIQALTQEYSNQNNSIQAFLDSCCIFNATYRIHNADLLSAYNDFCSSSDFIPETYKAFHKYLKQMPNLRHTRFRINENNENGYYGICLKEE